jgi:hypothetical protein
MTMQIRSGRPLHYGELTHLLSCLLHRDVTVNGKAQLAGKVQLDVGATLIDDALVLNITNEKPAVLPVSQIVCNNDPRWFTYAQLELSVAASDYRFENNRYEFVFALPSQLPADETKLAMGQFAGILVTQLGLDYMIQIDGEEVPAWKFATEVWNEFSGIFKKKKSS